MSKALGVYFLILEFINFQSLRALLSLLLICSLLYLSLALKTTFLRIYYVYVSIDQEGFQLLH